VAKYGPPGEKCCRKASSGRLAAAGGAGMAVVLGRQQRTAAAVEYVGTARGAASKTRSYSLSVA